MYIYLMPKIPCCIPKVHIYILLHMNTTSQVNQYHITTLPIHYVIMPGILLLVDVSPQYCNPWCTLYSQMLSYICQYEYLHIYYSSRYKIHFNTFLRIYLYSKTSLFQSPQNITMVCVYSLWLRVLYDACLWWWRCWKFDHIKYTYQKSLLSLKEALWLRRQMVLLSFRVYNGVVNCSGCLVCPLMVV